MNSVLSFFNVARPWDVTWAHRVNSRAALEQYCGSPDVMMIEGDISRPAAEGRIIMAHPPRQESDLTFEGWIEGIIRARKGAKLDFKDPSVVTACLEKLREHIYAAWIASGRPASGVIPDTFAVRAMRGRPEELRNRE